jgi:septum formation protein
MKLVLASQSASRRAMLDAAGVPYEAVRPQVDEDSAKAALLATGISPRNLADALAELKAVKLSGLDPTALVLGGDSVVALADGRLLDKPVSRENAAEHLRMMAGTSIDLFSAAVIAEGGRPVWRHVERARLVVRPLSEAFIESYLDREWPAISGCVGCFRIEGLGVQLFTQTTGSHFTILGMPLLNILDYLRVRGVLTS